MAIIEVLPGRLFQEQRLVVGCPVGPQYYTDLIYSSSLLGGNLLCNNRY